MSGTIRRCAGLCLAGLLMVAPAGTGRAETMVMDQILKIVNGQPITRSRVDFFRGYLIAMQGEGLGWPRAVPEPARLSPDELLDKLVIDELLFEGASGVEAILVREKDLSARIAEFQRAFPSLEAYRTFVATYELTPDVLREFFSRRLRVEGYIALKVGAARPSDGELMDYYRGHQGELGERPYSEVKDEIARRLYAERVAEHFEQWVGELKERASIREPSRAPYP